jgi:predicted O-linked N-acetylglucosamine transferase (SPINDLY family)/GT2 family glycosyltransferase/ubiquinone/menaquinone biosynthesis C-methylase UbiE
MSAENKITIITSVRNCMTETKLYLNSLKKHGSAFLDKIIIIDDGSDRETREFLNAQRASYELYRNEKSMGFAFSNNYGASKATSGWLLFLNNDLILKKGWSQSYDSLVQGNHKLINMGCAGNIQLDPMYGKIDHAGVTFTNGIPEHFLKGENSIPTNDHTEFLAVTGACFMIQRDLFLDVGGFDETYKTGFEDVDLCLRLSMLGYKNYVLNKSVIIHKRSSTPERNQYQKHNSHIFYGRWGKIITRFQEWELAKRKLELNKKSSLAEYGYVLNKKEAFLFSDRNILHEYFATFLRQRNLKFANQVLSILVEKFSHEEETQFKRAQFLSASGELKQAKATLGQILQTNPEHLDASLLKQKLCLDEGDIKIALKVVREAEKYHPDSPRVFLGICKCMQSVGKWQEAERNARISTLLDSSFNPGWKALSLIFKKQGNTKDEIRILRLLLDREPQDLRVLDQLIAAYASLQLTQEIWGLCHHYESRIVTIASLLHCAKASYGVGDFKRCTFFVEKVLSENSFNTNALMLRGNQAVASKQFSRAIKDYEKVLDFKPDSWEALSNLSNSKSFICDWNGRDLEVKSLLNWNNKEAGKFGVFEVSGLYLDESGEFNNAIAKAEFFNKKIQLLKQKLNFSYVSNKGSLKKLGFLSSDFRNHAVGHQLIGLLENLDAEKYEIFIFATSPSEDSEIRKRFEVFGENFRDISDLPLAAKARSIHHANLDLLIDLGGFSRGHNAELLALRPSPRQAHFLGYASTMGKGLVDYTIADRVVIPTSSSKFYGEKVIRMDGCFFPPGEFEGFAPRVKRKEVGLPSRGFVFCAFHAAYKLDPETWASWMRILRAVPESILWLKFKPAIESIKNLTAEAVRQGVSSKRIIMAKDLPDRAAHLSRMTVADLYLDCPLYNGHASAMDALHAKLPILTLKGKRFCSRVGETFMRNLGLPEMVTKNLDEYEKKAIELGRRPSRLLPLRKKISENADAVLSPVLHAKRFQSAIEQILSKKPKISKELKTAKPKVSVEIPNALSLKDFTLVMIRPIGVTNWACNVNMLADELISYGGQTIVIEAAHSDHKTADFSKFVKRVPQLGQSYADILNLVLSKVSTKYLFYLDDPLRALPAKHFSECLHQAQKNLLESKIGFLGVGSNMEPNTGVLVTTTNESSGAKIGGLFAPAFALNLDALTYTGGFRPYNKSLALSCLDLSLRMEQQGYRSSLVEVDKFICPVHTGNDYLKSAGESMLTHFNQLWNRKPVSLKPKYPPKEEQVGETPDYQEWIRLCDTINEGDISAFREEVGKLQNKPLISVIMPVFDPPKKFLIKAIESVLSQTYENWELCIADDASTKKFVRPLLEGYARKDPRIKVTFRETNGHISVASNSALKLATGEFVAFLDHDDELRTHSLLEIAKVINTNPTAKLIYSDEDKIDEKGVRYDPYFKPDWNPDLLLGQNYISHFSVFESALVSKLKGLRKGYEGSQDWDLTLRFTEQIKKTSILHIPKVLYHWRAIKGSTATDVRQKKNIFDVTEKAITECFERRKLKATLTFPIEGFNYPRVRYLANDIKSLKVSILIPTKDRVDLLEKCITSIFATIEHNNFQVIIIDNESREKCSHTYLDKIKKDKRTQIVSVPGEFNYSKLNNLVVEKAKGEILLLLNNDIEAISKGWFEEMLSFAMRPEIGCVGAKLLYPDGRLQHGGVIVGLGGGAGHSHKFAGRGSRGYSGHLCVARNVSAVTAACMMVRKEIYKKAGGLDELRLKVAFNDVDFSLRVEKLGYRNLWTPFAELVHHESATRGNDQETTQKRNRSYKEIISLQNRWCLKSYDDPHYNTNLTKLSEQYWYGIEKKPNFSSLTSVRSAAHNMTYDSGKAYRKLFRDLSIQKGEYDSTFLTVGGKSEKMGQISLNFLRKFGLGVNDFLVDVGCGYGRLVEALNTEHKGQYLGTDVVPELLNYARANFGRKGWDFKLVDRFVIPAQDNSADMVCFFSVFTHLPHEQSFTYLKEVRRILRDEGKVVFSFLDFKDPVHVPFFEGSVAEMDGGHPMNVFMNKDLIQVWAKLLGFECLEVLGAEEKKSLGHPYADFGQSIACLKKVNQCLSENKGAVETKLGKFHKLSLTGLQTEAAISKRMQKKDLILAVLKKMFHSSWNGGLFNCMPKDAEQVHGIVETENISEHEYDGHAIEIIESIGDSGIILDCGSGKRPTYYSNVVNFDPVLYETTDVAGVGEELPFKDSSFDAVFSLNVLEHVRDPLRCAREIARVLKPEGSLYCVVPFMSPYHGYPDHYYNMTKSGLHNLFKDFFEIEKQDVLDSGHPIHSITWVLRSWTEGLGEKAQKEFLGKKVASLVGDPNGYFNESFVNDLSLEKKFELGATTALWGKKKQFSLEDENPVLESEWKQNFERNDYKGSWNRLSLDFDSARHHVTGDADEEALKKSSNETISRIDRYVKFNKNDIVLEIGCGIGRVGRELASKCKKWIGCDISGNMLGHAQERLSHLKNIDLVELPSCNLSPILDSSIDVVYCTVVFMHLDEWDRYEYVKEAFRVLRNGGRAYFDNFSLNTKEGWRIFEEHCKMSERPSHISKSSTVGELSQYMEKAKFTEVNTALYDPWVIVSGSKI